MDLKDIMEFDHVIRVHEDGSITHPDVYPPEVYMDATWDEHGDAHTNSTNDRDMMAYLKTQGWDVLTGWTSQYGYNGPIMHVSEFIGGRLEEHIRENPGMYVRMIVEIWPPNSVDGGECIVNNPSCSIGTACRMCMEVEPQHIGWIVAYR